MKKSFTLVELMVVVIVCGILATVAIPTYQNFMDESKAKVCYTNQLTVLKAVDAYTLENDQMPTTLSMLPAKYIQKAYAQIIPKASWDIKLAYWLVDREGWDMAYAQSNVSWIGKFISDTNILKCPLDPYAHYSPYPSYSIGYIPGGPANYTVFKSLPNTTAVIHDNGAWHKRKGNSYAVGVNSQGGRLKSPGGVSYFSLDNGS